MQHSILVHSFTHVRSIQYQCTLSLRYTAFSTSALFHSGTPLSVPAHSFTQVRRFQYQRTFSLKRDILYQAHPFPLRTQGWTKRKLKFYLIYIKNAFFSYYFDFFDHQYSAQLILYKISQSRYLFI